MRAPTSPERGHAVDVLVVGGGPCGLAIADAAAARGLVTTLLEGGPHLGGMARSITVAGQRVDLGSHRIHPRMTARVRRLLDELLGADLQVRERDGRLRLRDRWVRFPFRPLDLARTLPPSFVAGAAADALAGSRRRAGGDSYADVIRTGLGPTALAEFHGPMAAKLWGLPPEELSGDLARKRLAVRTTSGLARRVARTARRSGRTFLSPRHGYGQITERLVERAAGRGARLETEAPVTGVRLDGGGSPRSVDGHRGHGVTVWVGGGEPRAIRARRVMWTAPLGALARTLDTAPPAGPVDVPHRGLVLTYLVVPTGRYTPFDAHYVPAADIAFSRLSEPRNYRDGPDPEDRTVLCAELPCTAGDETWRASADDLRRRVLDGLRRCGLPEPPVAHTELVRLPAVYPVRTTTDPDDRCRSLAWADGLPGITAVGRHGRVTADNLHHVLEMALCAVDCIADDGDWDAAAWSLARRGFESFVVED